MTGVAELGADTLFSKMQLPKAVFRQKNFGYRTRFDRDTVGIADNDTHLIFFNHISQFFQRPWSMS